METIIHTSSKAIAFEQDNITSDATFTFIEKSVGAEKFLKIQTFDGEAQSLSMILNKQEALALSAFLNEMFQA
jgi:hypothetical protein